MSEDQDNAHEAPNAHETHEAPLRHGPGAADVADAANAPDLPVAPGPSKGPGASNRDDKRPSLTTQVRRRRADQAFFLRLRDAIHQNHKALERMGT